MVAMSDETYLAAGAIGASLVVVMCVCFAACRVIRTGNGNKGAPAPWYEKPGKTSDYGSTAGKRSPSSSKKKKRRKKKSDASGRGLRASNKDNDALLDPALIDSSSYNLSNAQQTTITTEESSTLSNEDAASVATSATSVDIGEKELLQTFLAVLQDGLVLVMHTSRGKPKRVKFWMEDTELMWRATRTVMRKKHCVDVNDISHVEGGKVTAVFRRASVMKLSDEVCLSLVCNNGSTIDLEASSRMEREAIKQGITMVVENARINRERREGVVAP